MLIREILVRDLNQTAKLAQILALELIKGDVITFKGNLGAGKTTFIKALLSALDNNVIVTSPTFNLLHIYEINPTAIWHFDLYRLKNKSEIYELGIEDAFTYGISLVEWPEIIADLLPKNRLDIEITFTEAEDERIIILSSKSPKWIDCINSKVMKDK